MRPVLAAIVVAIVASTGCEQYDSRVPVRETRKPPMPPETTTKTRANLYPYVVPEAYLQHQSSEPDALTRPLGHGLSVVLVFDFDGIVGNATGNDLTALNLTAKEAHQRAIENLTALVKTATVDFRRYDDGPQQRPFIVAGYHWAAATCIL